MNEIKVGASSKSPFNPLGQRVHYWLQWAGTLSAPAAILFLLILSSLNLHSELNSNWLLLVLNTLFITVIGFVVAAVAAWSYSRSGGASLMLLGCASLALALGALFSGIIIYFTDGVNDSVTVYSIAALVSGLLHLAGAITVSLRHVTIRKPKIAVVTILYSYIGVLAFVEIIAFATDRAILPVFFVDNVGPTLIRQIVLASTIMLFASSSGLFYRYFFKSHSVLAFWYGLGLGMLAIGLWSTYHSDDLANAASWAGRFVQYVGSVYILLAVLAVRINPGSRIPLKEALTAFQYEAKENYQSLLDTAMDAIVVVDEEGRILLWNSVTESMFGHTLRDAMGSSLASLILPPEQADWLGTEMRNAILGAPNAILNRTVEMVGVRRDGTTFPIEFTASIRETLTGWVTTLIIRDITVRKRALAAHELSQQRLNLALHNAPILLSSQDRELRYTWIESFRTDFISEKLVGKTDLDVFPAEQARYLTALKNQVIESGEGARTEIALTSDRGPEYLDLTVEPMRDPDGATIGVYSVGFDVTERKRLLDEVEEERTRWKATVESMVNAAIVLNADGTISFANAAATELIGDLTRTDLKPTDIPSTFGLFHADGTTPFEFRELPIQRALAERCEIRDVEMVSRRPDGKSYILEWNAAPLFDKKGEVLGAVGIGRNVTAERHSLAQQQELLHQVQMERDKLQALVESIVDEVWFADADGNITLLNPGTTSAVAGGSHDSSDTLLVGKEKQVLLRALRGEIIQNEEQVVRSEETGQVHYRQISAAPISDRAGRILGAVAIGRDVTDQKRAERQIEELNRDLERRASELQIANRELESFAYSVSHDLRTPLTSIDSFSRLVLADYAGVIPADGKRYLQLIRDNVDAMDRLIRDLLTFSRAGRQPLKTNMVDMNTLVRQVMEELKPLQIGRTVELVVNDLPSVKADAALLKQVWLNLLTNAFKFTRRRASARIEVGSWDVSSGTWKLEDGIWTLTRTPGEQLLYRGACGFYVRDNGVGFAMDQVDKLFGVFQRLHSEEEYEGTGVGLAIVQRVISRHGGRVWALGGEDIGAMFCFAL